ncbi:MAG: 3-isopropylmalate dehydratase small subunit [Nitrososphaerota archaeon]|nr:3-isopropylmalate dehydratase small subunit [Nitrososphaerota archaeon]
MTGTMDSVSGKAVPLVADDVDTDQIIPAQFLRLLTNKGLGKYLFYGWRHLEDGRPKPGFVLDDPRFKGAPILVAGRNFGIGSSRENAVWALMDHGFQCVIAPSFGDIFYSNAAKNYLVCVRLGTEEVAELQRKASGGDLVLKVDLLKGEVTASGGISAKFEIEPAVLKRLRERRDDIEFTKRWEKEIVKYESSMRRHVDSAAGRTLFETESR